MRYFLFIVTTLFSTLTLAQSNKEGNLFLLEGKVIGQDTGYVHLFYTNNIGKYMHDSCYLKSGTFKFTGTIDEPTNAVFEGNTKSKSVEDPNVTDIFIEPKKMHAVFEFNNFKHAKILASKSQNEWNIYTNGMDSLDGKWKTMLSNLNEARKNNDKAKVELIYDKEIPTYRLERYEIAKNFIKQYPNSFVSAYSLNYLSGRITLDSLKNLYISLSTYIQQSIDGKKVRDFITKSVVIDIDKQAPAFTQPDISGKQISLRNFAGKFVLLEFWASWCAPCREETPNLKKAYERFHNKGFEIVSISLDGSKQAWLEAIKKDAPTWIQLCDFKERNNEVANQYNIYSIPANFLIDPNGKIVAKDLRGTDLEKKLSELIKK
jgi:peroxiredoxin